MQSASRSLATALSGARSLAACSTPSSGLLQALTAPQLNAKDLFRQRGTGPGRHHVGTPGDIISECPGDFVGIRTLTN
jgi:hypothetical protein